MTEADARKILGVKDNASLQEIKSSFRRLVKKHHPDMKGGGSAVRFREVENAYSLLIKKKKPSSNQSKPKEEPWQPSYKPQENFINGTVYVFDFGHEKEFIKFRWVTTKHVFTEYIEITKERFFTTEAQSVNFKNIKINIIIERLELNEEYVKEAYNTIVYYVKVDFFDFLFGKRIRFPPVADFLRLKVLDVESVDYEGGVYHQRIETILMKELHNTNVHKIYADVTFDPTSLPLGQKILYHLWKLKEFLKRKVKPTVK